GIDLVEPDPDPPLLVRAQEDVGRSSVLEFDDRRRLREEAFGEREEARRDQDREVRGGRGKDRGRPELRKPRELRKLRDPEGFGPPSGRGGRALPDQGPEGRARDPSHSFSHGPVITTRAPASRAHCSGKYIASASTGGIVNCPEVTARSAYTTCF